MPRDRPILILAFSQTLVWAGLYYIFPASLLRWEVALGWSKAELAYAATIATLASAFASPIAGRIIDEGRGPRLMGVSSALGGLCIVLLSQVTQLWQFYTLWLFIGLMLAGCLYDACFSIVTRARGADAKRGIVTITLVAGFAGTVSFPTVHFLSDAMGWRAATAIMGAAVVFVVAPMQWLGANAVDRNPGLSKIRASEYGSGYAFLRNPVFWLLGFGWAVLALVHGATLYHLLAILAERGIASGTAVVAASGIGAMQVVGRLAMVASQRFLSNHAFALISFAMLGGSVLLLNFAGSNVALVAAFVLLFGSAWGVVSILRPVIARDVLGEERFASKSGGLSLLYLVAVAASAYFGAVVWSVGGYGLLLVVLPCLALFGAGLYAFSNRLALSSR